MPATADPQPLTPRWRPMLMHPERRRLLTSRARHRVVAAGRRSGKSEDAKRIILVGDRHHAGALCPPQVPNPRFGIFAPTREQVKRIWWDDIKAMSPREFIVGRPNETDLVIHYVTGAKLYLIGLDRPQRAEGDPFDGVVIDETQEIKPEAWSSSLRPTLDNRGRPPGWSLRIGRPRGRTHFYDWWRDAATAEDSAAFHWKSNVVLSPEAIEAARKDLDPLTFAQEYEADWINFQGGAYHCWHPTRNLKRVAYDASLPLIFCLDFNVNPGAAAIVQERAEGTCVIGQVDIQDNSNTPSVCRRLLRDWSHVHKGPVLVYGDATGGRRDTRSTTNDWDVIRDYLVKGCAEDQTAGFRDVRIRAGRSNPHERDRLNSVNTRLHNAGGQVRLFVDPVNAPMVVRCFEGTMLKKDGSGEIDKQRTPKLTHWTDGLGYYVHQEFPIDGRKAFTARFVGA